MNCPRCGSCTAVTDSRPSETLGIRRRRRCVACACRFTTMESVIADVGGEEPVRSGAAHGATASTIVEFARTLNAMSYEDRLVVMTVLRRFAASSETEERAA
jgi:hypothetical protein